MGAWRRDMGLSLAFASLSRLWAVQIIAHSPLTWSRPSEQELSKASGAFDLTENGFDDLLAQSVAAASPGAFELEGHSAGREARTRNLVPPRRDFGSVRVADRPE